MDRTFVSREELAALIGVKARTVSELVKSGGLPPPIKFSDKLLRWDAEQLEKWFSALQAANG